MDHGNQARGKGASSEGPANGVHDAGSEDEEGYARLRARLKRFEDGTYMAGSCDEWVPKNYGPGTDEERRMPLYHSRPSVSSLTSSRSPNPISPVQLEHPTPPHISDSSLAQTGSPSPISPSRPEEPNATALSESSQPPRPRHTPLA